MSDKTDLIDPNQAKSRTFAGRTQSFLAIPLFRRTLFVGHRRRSNHTTTTSRSFDRVSPADQLIEVLLVESKLLIKIDCRNAAQANLGFKSIFREPQIKRCLVERQQSRHEYCTICQSQRHSVRDRVCVEFGWHMHLSFAPVLAGLAAPHGEMRQLRQASHLYGAGCTCRDALTSDGGMKIGIPGALSRLPSRAICA